MCGPFDRDIVTLSSSLHSVEALVVILFCDLFCTQYRLPMAPKKYILEQ